MNNNEIGFNQLEVIYTINCTNFKNLEIVNFNIFGLLRWK